MAGLAVPAPGSPSRLGGSGPALKAAVATVVLCAVCAGAKALSAPESRAIPAGGNSSGAGSGAADGDAFVARGGRGFQRSELEIEKKRAFDLGVVDWDQDGRLDLFTTNHMFRDTLLRGQGDGSFKDAYDDRRFSPTPEIASITDLGTFPEREQPGLYFFVKASKKRPNLHLRTDALEKLDGISEVSGTIDVVFPRVKVKQSRNAEVEVENLGPTSARVSFRAGNEAHVVLRAHHIDLPFSVEIDRPMPLESVFLGAGAEPAPERRFEVRLGDRHGIAWADYNGDRRLDAYAVRGGLNGNINELPGILRDELLLARRGGFEDSTVGAGTRKGVCRGRESIAADATGDGVLDIAVGCIDEPPRFYEGNGDGTFRNRSRHLEPVGSSVRAMRWIDLRGDRRPELVAAGGEYLRVWQLDRSGPARLLQMIRTRNTTQSVEAIAPGDIDGDGDLDLFVASLAGNTVMINRGGRLAARNPARSGLPARSSSAASWIDYDNDGRLDLHTVPDGVFRARGKLRFARTGLVRTAGSTRFARASWFDPDGDGLRDVALLIQRGTVAYPNFRYYERTGDGGNWLQLDLEGSRSNRQAIGARVSLRAGGRTITQWVGQNEGSRYSQGHYRLYFGLGKARSARQVTVHWPEGGRTKLGAIRANRVRRIAR